MFYRTVFGVALLLTLHSANALGTDGVKQDSASGLIKIDKKPQSVLNPNDGAVDPTHAKMWSGERKSRVGTAHTYTAAMHNSLGLTEKYAKDGEYFYRDGTNSFGFKEAVNPELEVLFCSSGDKNFSTMIAEIHAGSDKSLLPGTSASGFTVRADATRVGFSPSQFDEGVAGLLANNVSSTAKGRFCYNVNDIESMGGRVDYLQTGAEDAVYCEAGEVKTFTDPVSGESCQLELDVDLKSGEIRYLRQLQGASAGVEFSTVAQGFLECTKDRELSPGSAPSLTLIANPSACSSTSRQSCNHTCDWAYEVVCDPVEMPQWGQCRAQGTLIFKDDVITVESVDALSYSELEGRYYRGNATMSCKIIGSEAKWVVTDATCDPQS
jgi:hypothetical protein